MFGRTPTKTVELKRHTELTISGERDSFTIEYDPDAPVAAYIEWVSKELDAGRRYRMDLRRAEERAKSLRGECVMLTAGINQRDERIKELEGELRKAPVCGICPDTQRLYQEVESWKSQSKSLEKRYAECDAALKSASRMPPITRRKVWRVCGAKGMQLIVLEGATTNPVTASEFWRAARKLGIPVDEVGNHRIEKDVMVFQCKGHLASLPPGPSAIETSVYVIE
jgi:hypothetical protein